MIYDLTNYRNYIPLAYSLTLCLHAVELTSVAILYNRPPQYMLKL